jgi:hypothetical protein
VKLVAGPGAEGDYLKDMDETARAAEDGKGMVGIVGDAVTLLGRVPRSPPACGTKVAAA